MILRTLGLTLTALAFSFSIGHARDVKVKRVEKNLYKCTFSDNSTTNVTAANRRTARSTCKAKATAKGLSVTSVDPQKRLVDKDTVEQVMEARPQERQRVKIR